jgi:hypothetical protein
MDETLACEEVAPHEPAGENMARAWVGDISHQSVRRNGRSRTQAVRSNEQATTRAPHARSGHVRRRPTSRRREGSLPPELERAGRWSRRLTAAAPVAASNAQDTPCPNTNNACSVESAVTPVEASVTQATSEESMSGRIIAVAVTG